MDGPLGFTVNRLSPALGAEIVGIDLGEDLSQQTIDAIRAAWNEHQVIVFRDQEIDDAQQIAFAARFGRLGARKVAPEALRARVQGVRQNDPNIMLVSNMRIDGKPVGAFGEGDMWYHIDSGYAERPYRFTFLYGMTLPSEGGNTLFADMYAAYETLPDDLKAKLAGRRALHIHEYKRSEKVDISGDISNTPHHAHPVFATHPETGRTTLFVDRLMTARIEGLKPADSEATLERLFAHAEQRRFVYEHVWRPGDVVAWDNRCVTHGRTWFPPEDDRLLRRCTVECETPVEMAAA